MDRLTILRNITTELYKDNTKLFYINMNFFYYLEDSLYRDMSLHNYLKSIILTPGLDIYNLYSATLNNPVNMLFNREFHNKIQRFMGLKDLKKISIENLETIVIPIHRIFYRFFVKGGAALKVFVEYLDDMDILDIKDIPSVANSATDLDSTIIVNPHSIFAAQFNELLLSLVQKACFSLIASHAEIYNNIDETFYRKLIKNSIFLTELTKLFPNKKGDVQLRLPSIDDTSEITFPSGYTVKPQGSQVKLTRIYNHEGLITLRLLLSMDIIDYRMEIHTGDDGSESGRPIEELLGESGAELIDITFYNLDNHNIINVWNWAINAVSFGSRYTLFLGLHDMITDLTKMITMSDPMLEFKVEKRKNRLDFLYKIYCNYRLIQHIFENNNQINKSHIILYCKNTIDEKYKQIGLSEIEIDTILPYIIGQSPNNFEIILYNFILNYVYKNDSIQYNLEFRPDTFIHSNKLALIDVSTILDPNTLEKIKVYIMNIFIALDITIKAKIFYEIVNIYNECQTMGNITLILYTAIYKSCIDTPELLSNRININYKQMIAETTGKYQSIFLKKELSIEYDKTPLNQPEITRLLINEKVVQMCHYFLKNIMLNQVTNIIILNKYPPYQITYSMKKHIMENTSYLLSYYEQILQLINQFIDSHREYLNKHKIDFFVIYEISKKYPISIYFRVPFTQNIDGISFNGPTDILFATISFEYIVNRAMEKEGFIKLYQYPFKSLLFKYT